MGTGGASCPCAAELLGWGQWQRALAVAVPLLPRSKAAGDPGYRDLAAAAAPHPPICQRPLVPLGCRRSECLFLFNYSFKKPPPVALSPACRVTNSRPEPPEVAEVAALPDPACSRGRGMARERMAPAHGINHLFPCQVTKSRFPCSRLQTAVQFVPPRRAALVWRLAGTGCPNTSWDAASRGMQRWSGPGVELRRLNLERVRKVRTRASSCTCCVRGVEETELNSSFW